MEKGLKVLGCWGTLPSKEFVLSKLLLISSWSSTLHTSTSSSSWSPPQTRVFMSTAASTRLWSCFGFTSLWWERMWDLIDFFVCEQWQTGHWRTGAGDEHRRWRLRPRDWLNPWPQEEQWWGLWPVCVYTWSLRWSFLRNFLSQWGQSYGLSSLWILSWIWRLKVLVKVLGQ